MAGVSVCRIAVGNDYWVYTANFELIAQGRYVSSEFGFNFVAWWLQKWFGYRAYLPIFGFFSILTVYFSLKAIREQSKWYAGSLFLFFTAGFYFSGLNNVRYYFALAIAIAAITAVLQGNYFRFVLYIIFAAAFHRSVLIVIPIYLLAHQAASHRLRIRHAVLLGIVVCSLLFGVDLYRKAIFLIYPFYEGSSFDVARISWVNVAKCAGSVILGLICYRDQLILRDTDKDCIALRFYFFLNVGALILYTCATFIPEISRIGYYMSISQIFLLPSLLWKSKKVWFRTIAIVCISIAFLGYFALFLKQSYAQEIRLLPYRNWIFQ
jgi:hypothetical protein